MRPNFQREHFACVTMQLDLTLQTNEREHILAVLRETPNKTRAALLLGIDRRTLYRKLEVYKRDGFVP